MFGGCEGIIKLPILQQKFIDIDFLKPFSMNVNFEHIRGSFSTFKTHRNGISYKTRAFGYIHNFVVYNTGPKNVLLGLERILSKRNAEIPGYDDVLRRNQHENFDENNSFLKPLFYEIMQRLSTLDHSYLTDIERRLDEWAEIPHPKRDRKSVV